MKNKFSTFAVLAAVLAVAYTLRTPRNPGNYDIEGFGRLPTLVNGRVKPIDTVARTSLLMTQGRQRVTAPDGRGLSPNEWLLDMLFTPNAADHYATFEVVHPDVLALLDLSTADGAGKKRFAVHKFAKKLGELDRQAKLADGTESAVRTPFQQAVVQLRNNVILYQRLQSSLVPGGVDDFFDQLAQFEKTLPTGGAAGQAARGVAPRDDPAAKFTLEMARTFSVMETYGYLLPVPPPTGTADGTGWKSAGAAWNETLANGKINPVASAYAEIGRAWRLHQPEKFNQAVQKLRQRLDETMPGVMQKCDVEARFNSSQPFYTSTTLYVIAFLLAVVSWLKWPEPLGRSAFGFVVLAFTVATVGIATRMWLEGRPPVTNLYSSALFVGWGAVALCLVLEWFYRNVLRGVLTRSLDLATGDALARMIYGIVCFATLFSFVGTVLGGIWADQSWGRFWGWDPKENGALLIVMWNAIILHARWGGLVRQRGLAALAIFGNIVTAWSWFGVNMLGVGLHSYGFMDAAFWWLVAFVASQLAFIAVAGLPMEKWRSFSAGAGRSAPAP
jgi:ABC-type transport system involved in cytochrome c biogenesis permease subunit